MLFDSQMIKPKWDMGMGNHIDKPYDSEDEVDPVDTSNSLAKAQLVGTSKH